MNYFKQLLYEMRHQKMMVVVSVSGTALSIFLVMAYLMSQNAKTVSVSPESNREYIFAGKNMHIQSTNPDSQMSSSGGLSYESAKRIYEGLEGVEKVTYSYAWGQSVDVGEKAGKYQKFSSNKVDEEFWNVFDYNFIYGGPFDAAAVKDGEKKVVINASTARKLFKNENAVGKQMIVSSVPYTVVGVIEDVNPLMTLTCSDIIFPLGSKEREGSWGGYMGPVQALLLVKPGVTQEEIARQVKARYATLNAELAKDEKEAVYHGQPYTADYYTKGTIWSNSTPDMKGDKNKQYIIYLLLLLLPAINLSSMTRGRLRHRVSEIGVRRAFGAKKSSIIFQILCENFVITVVGGIIGLLLSVLFIYYLSSLFLQYGGNDFGYTPFHSDFESGKPSFGMLFTWSNFIFALVFCFVLNLLSAFIPAWNASRVSPADAISKAH